MAIIRKNIKLVYLLVIPAYLFVVHNSISNKHTHFYANGIIVTHSHPVGKKDGQPINKHNHTKTEICFFHSIHLDAFIVPDVVFLKGYDLILTKNFFVPNERINSLFFCLNTTPRAPPTLIC